MLIILRCSCVIFTWFVFFFSSRRRHTRFDCDWSSDVCSSDLGLRQVVELNGTLNVSSLATVLLTNTFQGLDLSSAEGTLRGSAETVMEHIRNRSEERRVGKECRSRWSPYH